MFCTDKIGIVYNFILYTVVHTHIKYTYYTDAMFYKIIDLIVWKMNI